MRADWSSRADLLEDPADFHRLVAHPAADDKLLGFARDFAAVVNAFLDRDFATGGLEAPAIAARQLEQNAAALAWRDAHIRVNVKTRGKGHAAARRRRLSLSHQPVLASEPAALMRQRDLALMHNAEWLEISVVRGIDRPAERTLVAVGADRRGTVYESRTEKRRAHAAEHRRHRGVRKRDGGMRGRGAQRVAPFRLQRAGRAAIDDDTLRARAEFDREASRMRVGGK